MAEDVSDRRKVFAFFRLPRELRDDIYDQALEDYGPLGGDSGLGIWLTSVAAPELLLVSRQFSEECKSRVEKYSTVEFIDHLFPIMPLERLPFPATAFSEVIVTIIVQEQYHCCARDLRVHEKWLPDMLGHFASAKNITLNITKDLGQTISNIDMLSGFCRKLSLPPSSCVFLNGQSEELRSGIRKMQWSHRKQEFESIEQDEATS